jgi:hypothetical protein
VHWWVFSFGESERRTAKAIRPTHPLHPLNSHNMQTVLYLPFFADAAMPIWMMGAYFLLIALAITALVMLVILFMRRKRK